MNHDDNSDSPVDVGGAALKSECVRRSVLRGAVVLGAVGVGGALSFIGGGSSSTASLVNRTPVAGAGTAPAGTAPAGTAPAGTAPAGTAPAGTAPAGTAPAKPGAAKGRALGAASKVPVGGGVIFAAAQVVVTQPTAGVYKAFDAMCTHEKCILADVGGGTINCACHGGKFSIADGSAVQIPAIDPLPAKTVTVTGGKLFVT